MTIAWVRRVGSIVIVAAKRLLNNVGLTLSIVSGLSIAVALAVGIPIYSDAVNSRMLTEELQGDGRPPYAIMYWYLGSNNEPLELEEVTAVNDYIEGVAPRVIGLPLPLAVRHMATDYMRLFATDSQDYPLIDQVLEWPSLGYLTDVDDHIEIIEGRAATSDPTAETIEVIVYQDLAERVGLQVGEEFVLVSEITERETKRKRQIQFPIRVVGVWRARDEREPYWFYRPRAFDKVLLISELVYVERIAPTYDQEVNKVVWYQVYDGSDVHIQDVSTLLSGIAKIEQQIANAAKGASIALSPEEAMKKYRRQAYDLVILLYVFSIPVIGLVLYFVILVSSMVVDRQRNEIALLRSRGTSQFQVFGIYVLEGLLIGVIAAGIGLVGGRALASIMGNAESFLQFSRGGELKTQLSRLSVLFAGLSLVLALVASLVPALIASKHTIVTYRRERARSHRRPFWQRFYLDFGLWLVVGYGYFVLARRGTISLFGGGEIVGDPFNNPILFLVPTMFILSGSLSFLRVFPAIMETMARASERMRGASLLLALRSLARSLRDYSGPLMLLVLTVGLATFTVSMARTLDAHLTENAYYITGGDFQLRERGELVGGEDTDEPAEAGAESSGGEEDEAHWEFLPAFDYLNVPRVEAVTRVGNYRVRVPWAPSDEDPRIGGIDSDTYLDVARLRADFATHSGSAMMTALSREPSALLVEREFFRRNKLAVGDKTLLAVYMLNEWREIEFLIAGTVSYFPGFYPEDGPFFIANLDYLFAQAGGMYGYDIWLHASPGVDAVSLSEGIRALGLTATIEGDALEEIALEKARPERQGFFGLLSVGFYAAAVITALGFLIYALVSFQRRAIELGVLRAIGLSSGQMVAYVVGEQLSLVVVGVVFGTVVGMGAGALFVPFLQVGSGDHAQTPPFVVEIPWSDILLILVIFGTMLAGVIGITVWLLRNMKIFQAVKMEEVE